jgi:hypothetical protein
VFYTRNFVSDVSLRSELADSNVFARHAANFMFYLRKRTIPSAARHTGMHSDLCNLVVALFDVEN